MNPAVSRLPSLFIGHGNPLTAFDDNQYTRGWAALAAAMPRPRAILCISAHWYTRGTGVTAMAQPRTVHDFYGFPDALYQYHYRAAGDPALAQRVAELLAPLEVIQDQQWGLDHGSWTILKHMYPQADVPVLQLSIDGARDPAWHYELGRQLQPLRDEGVLLMGSGNIVHNLRYMLRQLPTTPAYAWAESFYIQVRDGILKRDHDALIHYERFGEAAALSVPTPEHFLPLLYVLGASYADEPVTLPLDEVPLDSISMLSVCCGKLPVVNNA
ncbi:MAG: 4,5-DOPA dioxygenase extradiol [Steroidobacteraceae bacterium]